MRNLDNRKYEHNKNWINHLLKEKFIINDWSKVKVIVPVSGGKDSQACLKMACKEFGSDHVLGLFCDTKFEHPYTYEHVNKLRGIYNVKIHTLNEGESVSSRCIARGRFPGGGARHCTNELKIQPTKRFLKEFATKIGGVEVWYGMRVDESQERAKRYEYKDPDDLHMPHDVITSYPQYLGKLGVRYRLPIVDWKTEEVFDYLDGEQNVLYELGFERVGCFPCLASGDGWKVKAFSFDSFGASQLIKVRIIEDETNKSVFTGRIGKAFNAGCLMSQNQVSIFDDLGDSSHGCRVCEI